MVDKLLFSDEKTAVSGFTILADNIFCENGFFTQAGMLENIAQTAAIKSAYQFKQTISESNEPVDPPIGFIGAINNFVLHKLPAIDSTIETTITIEAEMMDISLISAVVKCAEEVLATCTMKIFVRK